MKTYNFIVFDDQSLFQIEVDADTENIATEILSGQFPNHEYVILEHDIYL